MKRLASIALFLLPCSIHAGYPKIVYTKDTLGGVTVGQEISTAGWKRDVNGEPFREVSLGGHKGVLFAELCGTEVQRLQFQVGFVNEAPRTSILPVVVAVDPMAEAMRVGESIGTSLEAAGWVPLGAIPSDSATGRLVQIPFEKGFREQMMCDPSLPGDYYRMQAEHLRTCTGGRSLDSSTLDGETEADREKRCAMLRESITAMGEVRRAAHESCPYERIEVVETVRTLQVGCDWIPRPLVGGYVQSCSVLLIAGSKRPCTEGL